MYNVPVAAMAPRSTAPGYAVDYRSAQLAERQQQAKQQQLAGIWRPMTLRQMGSGKVELVPLQPSAYLPYYLPAASVAVVAADPMYGGKLPAEAAVAAGVGGAAAASADRGLFNFNFLKKEEGAAPHAAAAAPIALAMGGAPPKPGVSRTALLVGCNYPGTSAALEGCVNDVFAMQVGHLFNIVGR